MAPRMAHRRVRAVPDERKAKSGLSTHRLDFSVPMVPPSVNHYVKHTRTGRHYVTDVADEFKSAVQLCALSRSVEAEAYSVEIGIYLGAGKRGDIDNFAKLALDSLVSAGVITSDAKVMRLVMQKGRDARDPRTEFAIEAWQAETRS